MDFTHLILLIGTNPLPNYVAAAYFLAQNKKLKTVSLVHTKETFAIAQRLQKIFKREHAALAFNYWGLSDPGNPAVVRRQITAALKPFARDKLHLLYTGGTKNMAVQSYRTVFVEATPGHASFSNLDAHDFRLKFDDGLTMTGDLRQEVALRIETLLELHDCRKIKPSHELDWREANRVVRQFIGQNLVRDFVAWKNEKIRRIFYESDHLRRPHRVHLEELQSTRAKGADEPAASSAVHPFHEQAMRLINAFPPRQAWKFDAQNELVIPDSKRDYSEKRGDFVQGILYLDGAWLEFYVKDLLQRRIKAEQLGFELMCNWRLVRGEAQKDFEIDVMLLNGYQLCGISITTAMQESLCKSKAFEILHRSQQMGGEEARAVLMTTLPAEKAQKISEDLQVDTGGDEQLKILGLDDLPPDRLWPKIKEHLPGK